MDSASSRSSATMLPMLPRSRSSPGAGHNLTDFSEFESDLHRDSCGMNWQLVTLWWTYKKLWKITIFNGKIHYKWAIFHSPDPRPRPHLRDHWAEEHLPRVLGTANRGQEDETVTSGGGRFRGEKYGKRRKYVAKYGKMMESKS